MKITKRQLKKLIAEEIAVVNKETIEDTVLDILSIEGGAAGEDPIAAALEDLENEEISLPEEPIEDMISNVAGVKRHTDGDYVDTTKLESKLRITKGQLKRIIKEEYVKILTEDENKKIPALVKKYASASRTINQAISSALQEEPNVDQEALDDAMQDYYDEMMGF
jgi:hypothetical protein